jgi:hypothetical protein
MLPTNTQHDNLKPFKHAFLQYASQSFFSKSPLHQKINEILISSSSQSAARLKMHLLASGYRGDQALYYHTFD